MEYVIKLNKRSSDSRVKELEGIFKSKGYEVFDHDEYTDKKSLYFIEPRCTPGKDIFKKSVNGSIAFGYAKNIEGIKYISLSDDELFIRDNNYLTALALMQIINKDFKNKKQKILICGWGKLTTQIEKVFTDWDISILNFNIHKIPELKDKYADKAYFEKAPFEEFDVIINTIPKELLRPSEWKILKSKTKIYELASPPYGFVWAGCDKEKFDYNILPALPGKYYPKDAAEAVNSCIERYLRALERPTIVLCITGSSCSYLKLIPVLKEMVRHFEIIPVLSPNADIPNRFTDITEFKGQLREITGHNIITNIAGAETLSANKNVKCSVIFPATGNTIAKLTYGITDTCVLMSAKALLRNAKPCIIGISTNDALTANARNIGELLNRKNIYFVPFGQDDIVNKPYSCVCDFTQVIETIKLALEGKQIQPILIK